MNIKATDFKAIKLKVASPEDILDWSHGEVIKPETINYRTQRSEKDGLFDEKIFGPSKDWECYCGKYKRIRYKGIVCDRCGVEVTRSVVRRERMGHIKLAVPVSHIWFLRSVPSRLAMILDLSLPQVESVIYFAGYMIVKVNEELKQRLLTDLAEEYKRKIKQAGLEKDDALKTKLKQLKSEAEKELNGIVVGYVLNEAEYRGMNLKYGAVFEAETGAEAVKKVIVSMNLQKELKELESRIAETTGLAKNKLVARAGLIKNFILNKINPTSMFLEVLPVLPPDLRPMVQLDGGRFASADLNDLYRRVINRNNRLKKLIELKAPEVITRNEKRMLQEAVDALIDNSAKKTSGTVVVSKRPLKSLSDMLKGKQGRFRQNLLGKRVDYSGRAVIVVGPELKLDECGIPKIMALELFKPFIIHELIKRELVHNVRAANRLIEEGVDEVWAILKEIIQGKVVLLNRAPTLHRLSIQAFKPILVEGLAIKIHPLVCTAFNADFDGDQMAVHLPITEEAQKEAMEIMLSAKNLLKPANGQPIMEPSKDIVLGVYFLTHINSGAKGEGKLFASKNEAVLASQNGLVDINAKIKIYISAAKRASEEKFLETSVGRIIFNQSLPNDFGFINKEMDKGELSNLVNQLIEKYGAENVAPMLDIIKKLGFEYATLSGITWSMGDLTVPKEKEGILAKASAEINAVENHFREGLLTEDERYNKSIEIWTDATNKINSLVPLALPKGSPILPIINSKSRGSWLQLNQMTALKGLVNNPSGRLIDLPILNSYKEGLTVLEYFISTHGARKGTADTALKTATAGYLTRRLVDIAQDVIIREEDCGDNDGIIVSRRAAVNLGQQFSSKLVGRFSLEDIKIKQGNKEKIIVKKGELIDKESAVIINKSEIEGVKIRSVFRCKTKYGVCQKCYGYDLGSNKVIALGEAVGIVAAQSIGEPGTQLTMRTFHTGGVAGAADITRGLPRVEELVEARSPKFKALLSEIDGTVIDVKNEGNFKTIVIEPDIVKPAKKTRVKKDQSNNIEYKVLSMMKIYVQKDDKVKAGDQLTEGHIDTKELYLLKGREAVENYILNEVQKIYTEQGSIISDKHLEVIIRQMFSRVRINDAGDSEFAAGEVLEKDIVVEANKKLKADGKAPAKFSELLMGISKVSHFSQSWMSAASFQETVKVLVNAAVSGKVDILRGLKENVIIGRLIPAGTGFTPTPISKKE